MSSASYDLHAFLGGSSDNRQMQQGNTRLKTSWRIAAGGSECMHVSCSAGCAYVNLCTPVPYPFHTARHCLGQVSGCRPCICISVHSGAAFLQDGRVRACLVPQLKVVVGARVASTLTVLPAFVHLRSMYGLYRPHLGADPFSP